VGVCRRWSGVCYFLVAQCVLFGGICDKILAI
jgi:hypothetical protein